MKSIQCIIQIIHIDYHELSLSHYVGIGNISTGKR